MKILAIESHGDDLELSAGGTIARFCQEKHEVYVNIVATSNYSSYDGTILRSIEESTSESIEGLMVLGVKKNNIQNLGFKTKKIPFNYILIEAINKNIDKIRPDLIMTHHLNDSHPDHINTGKATLAAARYYNTIWMYEPIYPSKLSNVGFRAIKYVNISNYLKTKIAALKKHQSQWKKYAYWEDLVTSLARIRGIEIKTQYAEAFDIIKEELR